MFTNHEGVTVHPDALAPGTEVCNWRVVERLGVGGYGAVYRVEDMARLGDFYALEVALYAGDERAEREVALLLTKGWRGHSALRGARGLGEATVAPVTHSGTTPMGYPTPRESAQVRAPP